jgi:hypothetical protein
MPSDEFGGWRAFRQIFGPFNIDRLDILFASLEARLLNTKRTSTSDHYWKPDELLIHFDKYYVPEDPAIRQAKEFEEAFFGRRRAQDKLAEDGPVIIRVKR